MYIKNAVEKAEKVKINPYYEVSAMSIFEIIEKYWKDPYRMCSVAFSLGYLQGSKAGKKEAMKGDVQNGKENR